VPSNYVQQLYGRDLEDFYQSMVVRLRECDDSATTTVPQNIEYMLPGEAPIYFSRLRLFRKTLNFLSLKLK